MQFFRMINLTGDVRRTQIEDYSLFQNILSNVLFISVKPSLKAIIISSSIMITGYPNISGLIKDCTSSKFKFVLY